MLSTKSLHQDFRSSKSLLQLSNGSKQMSTVPIMFPRRGLLLLEEVLLEADDLFAGAVYG